MQKAYRGKIYQFLSKEGTESDRKVLVISSDNRSTDKLVSILMLGDIESGADTIEVMEGKYVHCGLVTYCERRRLGEEFGTLPTPIMEEIDKGIRSQLGMDSTDYKKLYEDLLHQLVNTK